MSARSHDFSWLFFVFDAIHADCKPDFSSFSRMFAVMAVFVSKRLVVQVIRVLFAIDFVVFGGWLVSA